MASLSLTQCRVIRRMDLIVFNIADPTDMRKVELHANKGTYNRNDCFTENQELLRIRFTVRDPETSNMSL